MFLKDLRTEVKMFRSERRMGSGQTVVRNRQADVVVVAVRVDVVGPADGKDVIRGQSVFREVVVTDDASMPDGKKQIQSNEAKKELDFS